MGRVPLSGAGQSATPYPYILILGQDDNERLMGERLREQGAAVTWNTELVGLAQRGRSRHGDAQGPGRHGARVHGGLGRRLRRRPQRGARP